jgi:hypothetical protein
MMAKESYVCPELIAWNETMRAMKPEAFEPLVVKCLLSAPMSSPDRHLALDALLAATVIRQTGQPQASAGHECVPVEIPIKRSSCGRFHMASLAQFAIEQRSSSFTNKRFPTKEAVKLSKMKRVETSQGATKDFRIPREHLHIQDDEVVWYCVGNRVMILDLLCEVTSLGKRRAVGLGALVPGSWTVEPITPWQGFPVVRDGAPLRTLPLDWPGLVDFEPSHGNLTYPYWDKTKEVPCAKPRMDW